MSSALPSQQSWRYHIVATLKLAFPVIVGQLGHVMMGTVDTLMIGQIGYVEISAAALANGIFFFFTIIGIGIALIVTPLVAEAATRSRPRRVADYLQQGWVLAGGLGISLTLVIWFSTPLMALLDQPAQDVALARTYLRILALGVLPMLIFTFGKHFVDGLSRTQPGMYVTLAGLVFNVFFNWVFIFGKLGFPALGLDGAGWGTFISRVAMMAMMLAYIYRKKAFAVYRQRWRGFQPHIIWKLLRLGVPSGLQFLFEVGAFIGAMLMVGWIGSAERAAHQIAIQLASITFMVVTGFSAGAMIRVGNALGRRNLPELQRAGYTAILLAASFMSLSGLTFYLGRDFFPSLFLETEGPGSAADNAYVLNLAAHLMILVAFFQIFDGVQAVAAGVLRGIQDVRIPTWVTFGAYWAIAMPSAYFFGFKLEWGLDGIWYALILGLILVSVAHLLRFRFLTRSRAQLEASIEEAH